MPFFFSRQLQSPTNVLLLSLAVADLLVGFMLMPVEIIYTEACWFLGDTLCTLYYVADYTITSACVANMVLISVDRYIAVCNPLRYSSTVTKRRTQVGVCLCWLCSLLYRFILLHEPLQHPGRSNACVGECVVVIENTAGLVDLVLTFVMPIAVIVALYFRVFVVALSQARALRLQTAAAAAKRPGLTALRKAETKAARSLGVVVLVFLLCFCPYYFPALAGEDTAVDAASVAVQIWLTHFNSCVNPLIYALFYPWFRRSIKLILTLQILKPGSCNAKVL